MRGGRGRRTAARWRHDGQRRGGYDPNQPRVPAGHRDGGQWTDDERWTSGRWFTGTLGTATRRLATRRCHERPPRSLRKLPLYLARKAIEAIHRELASWDLFGHHNPDKVTVAVTTMDGEAITGTSSRTTGIGIAIDHFEARALRATIMRKYPHLAKGQNSGQFPLDAFFHAETNLLLRAARKNGRSLAGKSLDVFVDNDTCLNCQDILGSGRPWS